MVPNLCQEVVDGPSPAVALPLAEEEREERGAQSRRRRTVWIAPAAFIAGLDLIGIMIIVVVVAAAAAVVASVVLFMGNGESHCTLSYHTLQRNCY